MTCTKKIGTAAMFLTCWKKWRESQGNYSSGTLTRGTIMTEHKQI